jgi:peroxiredoxin
MKLIYLTLPLGGLLAASGIWLIAAASHASPSVGTSPSSGTEPRHPVTRDMAVETAAMAGKTAPDFKLSDSKGKDWTLAGLSQGKPVYLYFILDGCPCSTDAEPLFHELYKRYKGQISFVGVIGSDQQTAIRWAKAHEMPYTILADPKLEAIKAYRAKHSVYNVLITPDRKIDTMWPGYSQDMLRDVNSRMGAVTGGTPKAFDPLYAPLKLSSGCLFAID